MVLIQDDWCLYKKRSTGTEIDGENHVKTEAEIGVRKLQARHCWPPLEVRKEATILP